MAASRNRFHRVWVDVKEGIDALRASRGLMLAFGQVSIAVLVLFMLFALAPAYVSNVIGIAPQDSYVILGPATGGGDPQRRPAGTSSSATSTGRAS